MISPKPLLRLAGVLLLGLSALSAMAAQSFRKGVNIDNWLSQNDASMPYAASWFSEEDVAWIAAQGFDHLRLPIDSRIWLKPDGSLDESKVAPFDRALGWVRKHHLGAILDVHFLDGADFNTGEASDLRVFTDPALMEKAARLWRLLAKRYANEGDYLRFELLNEPKADKNSQLNVFSLRMLAAIRESNPTRFVYFPVNKWNTIPNVADVELPAKDPNVGVTVHFYEPIVFTHQKASWVFPVEDKMPAVPFPGKVPDLTAAFKGMPEEMRWAQVSGVELSVAKDIEERFKQLEEWSRGPGRGREVLLGEFGVFFKADAASTVRWTRAVRQVCERNGYGWAVWGYRSVFPVRQRDGSPAPMLEGLFRN